MTRPNYLILGAGKCGTTSLHELLGQHPDVFATPEKEPPFFDAEFERGPAYYWSRYFGAWSGERAAGEARPSKIFLPFVPKRVRDTLPDAKLIVILRHPVDRLVSHWAHRVREARESWDAREALAAEDAQRDLVAALAGPDGPGIWRDHLIREGRATRLRLYRTIGRYADGVERYLHLYPRERIRFVRFEDFARDPARVVRNLWGFLGVDPELQPQDLAARNEGMRTPATVVSRAAKRTGLFRVVPRPARRGVRNLLRRVGPRLTIPESVRRELLDYYRPHTRRLETMLQWDLADWLR